jgi:hypothetical protein
MGRDNLVVVRPIFDFGNSCRGSWLIDVSAKRRLD